MLGAMARKKSHAGKLNVRLPRDLNTEFRTWLQGAAERHTYFGRRLSIEPTIGALVAAFLAWPRSEQEKLLAEWLPRLEEREKAEVLGEESSERENPTESGGREVEMIPLPSKVISSGRKKKSVKSGEEANRRR